MFVTVNVGLSISVCPTAVKAKLDKGAQGNIYTTFETVSAVVSWESHTRTFTFSDHSLWRGKTTWETPIEIDCGVAIFFVMEAYGLICTSCHWATNIPATQTCLSILRCTIKFTVERQSHSWTITPIKDKNDLMKRCLDCFDGVEKIPGSVPYHCGAFIESQVKSFKRALKKAKSKTQTQI